MRRIRLTATEQAHLEHLFKTTPDRRFRDRCQAVLMTSRGRMRKMVVLQMCTLPPVCAMLLAASEGEHHGTHARTVSPLS
jgi:hypothetical protein